MPAEQENKQLLQKLRGRPTAQDGVREVTRSNPRRSNPRQDPAALLTLIRSLAAQTDPGLAEWLASFPQEALLSVVSEAIEESAPAIPTETSRVPYVQYVDDVLKEIVESKRVLLAQNIANRLRGIYNEAVSLLGPTVKGVYNHPRFVRVWRETIAFVLKPGLSHAPKELDETKLTAYADRSAKATLNAVYEKLRSKLGKLDEGQANYMSGLDFRLTGTRNGRSVQITQSMIVNVSSKGKLFNQFPALIYVDGKKVSAKQYAAMFGDREDDDEPPPEGTREGTNAPAPPEREAFVASPAPLPREEGAISFTLDEAIQWANEAARALVGTTYFEASGKMVKDELGASGSTLEPLKAYATQPTDAPLDVHAAGLELLRQHSHTQLDRTAFERAAAAIEGEMVRTGQITPPRVYRFDKSVKSGLGDGSHYQVDLEKKKVVAYTPFRQSGTTVNDLLYKAGIPRDAYRWDLVPGSNHPTRKWLHVRLPWVEKVADAVAPLYPELAAALKQNAPTWLVKAGLDPIAPVSAPAQAPEAQAPEASAPAQHSPVAQGTIDEGTANGMPYHFDRENYRIVFDTDAKGMRATDMKEASGGVAGWFKDPSGKYYAQVPLKDLPALVDALKQRSPGWQAFAAAIEPLVPQWMEHKAPLKQTREEGAADGGSWTIETSTTPGGKSKTTVLVALDFVDREPGAGWQRQTSAKGRTYYTVIGFSQRRGGSVWPYVVAEKKVPQFADQIRGKFPRLAEALNRTFGGVAVALDEAEVARCRALAEMHHAIYESEITTPLGLQALGAVRSAFDERGPRDRAPLDFQWVGMAFALASGFRALIADMPGLGKTVEGLGAIITDPGTNLPALIVAPKNVVVNWQREAAAWLVNCPGLDGRPIQVKQVGASGAFLPPGFQGIGIVSYEAFTRRAVEIIEFGFKLLIVDEAHYCKSPGTGRGKAFQAVGPKIPHVIELTGTPMKNQRVGELWPLLSVLDPDAWGKLGEFKRKYAGTIETIMTATGGTVERESGVNQKTIADLKERLACTMIRRRKADVLRDLPPKEYAYAPVTLTGEEAREYDEANAAFLDWYEDVIEEESVRALAEQGIPEAQITEQDRAAIRAQARERVDNARRAEVITQMGKLRELVGRFKVDHALALVRNLVDQGEPVILWANFKQVVRGLQAGLKELGIPYATIDGTVSAEDRADITERFQAGQIMAIIGTMAAKEGLTLTRASHAIFVERYWTPADEEQAEDRIHRIGQKKTVQIIRMHAAGTIDTYMDELLREKARTIEDVLGGETDETPTGDTGETLPEGLIDVERLR